MKGFVLGVILMASTAEFSQETAPAREPLRHTQSSFDVLVKLPYAETAPLFGPEGERLWAGKHWDPQFVYPQPARDVEGAIFTIKHGSFNAVWVNTIFDVGAGHFQYVYFMPDLMVTTIDVRFKPIAADATEVHVMYTRAALTAEGNAHVVTMTAGDKTAGPEWQQAIEAYLADRKQ
jgi:hypothetical protein